MNRASSTYSTANRWFIRLGSGLLGIAVLAGSFLGTLWFLNVFEGIKGPEIPPVAILENSSISDDASMEAAAIAAGFEPSSKIGGNVESLTRLSPDQVRIGGWVADLGGDGNPIDVLGFSESKSIFHAQTNGERSDITAALKLTPGAPATRNVAFVIATSCHAGEKIIVAAFTQSKKYAPIPMIFATADGNTRVIPKICP
jgi:hypothetical protein